VALISRSFDPERREFVRVRADLPVKYKFLSQDQTLVTDEVFDGTTSNISGAGILLVGQMPNSDWITGLLMERIVVGINLFLPGEAEPVKALTRTAWIEAIDERSQRCSMGLRFREITKDHLDRLFKFVIRAQMP